MQVHEPGMVIGKLVPVMVMVGSVAFLGCSTEPHRVEAEPENHVEEKIFSSATHNEWTIQVVQEADRLGQVGNYLVALRNGEKVTRLFGHGWALDLRFQDGRTTGPAFLDVTGDGRPELLVHNFHTGLRSILFVFQMEDDGLVELTTLHVGLGLLDLRDNDGEVEIVVAANAERSWEDDDHPVTYRWHGGRFEKVASAPDPQ